MFFILYVRERNVQQQWHLNPPETLRRAQAPQSEKLRSEANEISRSRTNEPQFHYQKCIFNMHKERAHIMLYAQHTFATHFHAAFRCQKISIRRTQDGEENEKLHNQFHVMPFESSLFWLGLERMRVLKCMRNFWQNLKVANC